MIEWELGVSRGVSASIEIDREIRLPFRSVSWDTDFRSSVSGRMQGRELIAVACSILGGGDAVVAGWRQLPWPVEGLRREGVKQKPRELSDRPR